MPTPPPPDIKAGDIIAGRYEVRGAVGRGGMGRIYRVFDRILGEEVALKTLLPDHVEDKVVMDRFFNEARIARSLSHPNVVRVHDIGQADGTVYISMELLKGKSLRQMLDQLQPGQRLPIAGILRMFDALCAALDYAHHFTVHRDIKPENVMILTDGSVKLMDFGISKLKSNPNLTSASIVMGTPHYMAPEQLRNTSTVDARADVYSVGVMLYEVITGDRPTGLAKPASKLRGEVPAALDPIIEQCCQMDPNKRYQTAGELRAALRAVRIDIEQKSRSGESSSAPGPRARTSGGRGFRIAAAALAMIAIAGGAVAGLRWAEERRNTILAAAPSGLATLPGPGAESDPASRTFTVLSERVSTLRTNAQAAALEYSEAQRASLINGILARGDALWDAAHAQASTNAAAALERGWDAAACYLAVTHWPPAMIFVPPASADEPRANGFFIDAAPMSIGAFDDFCRTQDWEWPAQAYREPADAPMTGAAYFDAVASLAGGQPPRRLPTADELERAVMLAADRGIAREARDFGQNGEESEEFAGELNDDEVRPTRVAMDSFYVPGNAYGFDTWFEWTSSVFGSDDSEPMFGDDVVTVELRWTASGRVATGGRATWRYEYGTDAYGYAGAIGFRGTLDLPRTLSSLDASR